jgi:hypothetical protein
MGVSGRIQTKSQKVTFFNSLATLQELFLMLHQEYSGLTGSDTHHKDNTFIAAYTRKTCYSGVFCIFRGK